MCGSRSLLESKVHTFAMCAWAFTKMSSFYDENENYDVDYLWLHMPLPEIGVHRMCNSARRGRAAFPIPPSATIDSTAVSRARLTREKSIRIETKINNQTLKNFPFHPDTCLFPSQLYCDTGYRISVIWFSEWSWNRLNQLRMNVKNE